LIKDVLQVTLFLLYVGGFMPHRVEALNQLKSGFVDSTVYLSLLLFLVLVVVFIGIMNVIHPGWMGEI
jgi:hypothetical protein